ncbi:RidA family protein [Jiangella asiatica]|uniref:RidA family protein n=1 Tax=Jiangella asiatica TaxID=2530372 RepID=A0A4R5DCK5_9ACTN|nr:RidA family protein [Jiangella asiatica]TDE09730.1 RidA family protein [Jiangella asiatica]
MPEFSTVPGAPAPGGAYSHAAVANGFLYTAGFGPQDPETGLVADDVGEQTRQVLRNLGTILAAHDLDFSDVVKTTAHLQHIERDFAAYNAAYLEFFDEPYPVRTTVGSQLLGILVEIDVVAALRT